MGDRKSKMDEYLSIGMYPLHSVRNMNRPLRSRDSVRLNTTFPFYVIVLAHAETSFAHLIYKKYLQIRSFGCFGQALDYMKIHRAKRF